jgi:hypothetical protein
MVLSAKSKCPTAVIQRTTLARCDAHVQKIHTSILLATFDSCDH